MPLAAWDDRSGAPARPWSNAITVVPFGQADSKHVPLTGIARDGARRMPAEALRAKVDAFVAVVCGRYATERTPARLAVQPCP